MTEQTKPAASEPTVADNTPKQNADRDPTQVIDDATVAIKALSEYASDKGVMFAGRNGRELIKELAALRAQLAEMQSQLAAERSAREAAEKERNGLHDQCKHWEGIAQRLASDALVALSRTVTTPEKGYLAEPHRLRGDIATLTALLTAERREREAERQQLAVVTAERDAAVKRADLEHVRFGRTEDLEQANQQLTARLREASNDGPVAPSEFKPDWASPPGDTIKTILAERGMSAEELAKQLSWSTWDLEQLFTTDPLSITDSIADLLGKHLGPSKEFWLNREKQYRNTLKRLALIDEIFGPPAAELPSPSAAQSDVEAVDRLIKYQREVVAVCNAAWPRLKAALALAQPVGQAADQSQRMADLERLARSFVTVSGHTLGCKCDEWVCRERERLLGGEQAQPVGQASVKSSLKPTE